MVGDESARTLPRLSRRHSLRVGAMIGVALVAAVAEIVFHQLLGWHHFYDRSVREVALMSDGVLRRADRPQGDAAASGPVRR